MTTPPAREPKASPATKAGQALLDAIPFGWEYLDRILAIEAEALPTVEELAAALAIVDDPSDYDPDETTYWREQATAILAAITAGREEAGR